MKNVIKNIKNSKGFVSIESILVIGVIVVLAGVILYFFSNKANDVSDTSTGQIDQGEVLQGKSNTDFSVDGFSTGANAGA